MSNEHFNLIARFYNKVAHFKDGESLIEAMALPVKGLLLDAGGGTGRVAAAIRGLAGGAVVADISLGMLGFAREKGLDCVFSPAEKLPFPTGCFERIIILDALHHVGNQGQVALELYRVVQPGGRLLIVEPDIHKFAVRLIALGEKLLLMRSHFLDGEQIRYLFQGTDATVTITYSGSNVWVVVEK